jgi:hypothetical protein
MACRTSGIKTYIQSVRYKFEHAYNIRRFLRLLWKYPVRHEATLINSLLTIHDYGD